MTLPVADTPLNRLIDATVEWHRIFASDRLRAHLKPGFEDILECFVGECRMVRWGLLATDDMVGAIWDLVMPGSVLVVENPPETDDNLVDYVLNGAAYIRTASGLTSDQIDDVIETITDSLAWPYRAKFIPNELKERVAEPEYLINLFTDSGWVLFMYLLTISPLEFKEDPLIFGPTSSNGDK